MRTVPEVSWRGRFGCTHPLCSMCRHSPLLFGCPHPPPPPLCFSVSPALSFYKCEESYSVGVDGAILATDQPFQHKKLIYTKRATNWKICAKSWCNVRPQSNCFHSSWNLKYLLSLIMLFKGYESPYWFLFSTRPQTHGQTDHKAGEVVAAAVTNGRHHGAVLSISGRWISACIAQHLHLWQPDLIKGAFFFLVSGRESSWKRPNSIILTALSNRRQMISSPKKLPFRIVFSELPTHYSLLKSYKMHLAFFRESFLKNLALVYLKDFLPVDWLTITSVHCRLLN